MKPLPIIGLVTGILFVIVLVAWATVSQAHGSVSPAAWLDTQGQTPALWGLDVVALYAVIVSSSVYVQHTKTQFVGKESAHLRTHHRAQLEAMIVNISKFEEVNAALADQTAEQQERIVTQEAQITEYQARTAAQEEQIAAQEAQIAEQQERGAAQEAQVAGQQERIVAQEAEITQQQARIAAQEAQVAEQQERLAAQEGQIAGLEERLARLQEQITGHLESIKAMAAQITMLQVENYTQADQIAHQAQQITAQTDQIAEQLAQIASQEESINSLSERNAALQVEIERRQEAFGIETRRLTEHAFRAMVEQVDLNTRQLDAMNRMLQYHQDELQRLRQDRVVIVPSSEPARITDGSESQYAVTVSEISDASPTTAVTALPDSAAAYMATGRDAEPPTPKPSAAATPGWQRKL